MLRTLDRPHQEAHSTQIDGFIARLANATDQKRELLIEHLVTARAYLLGAMPKEYVNNLQLAGEVAATLSDRWLRSNMTYAISDLLRSVPESPPLEPGTWRHYPQASVRPRATGGHSLSTFFRGSDVTFGIFYPKKHIVAAFLTFERARAAGRCLSDAGYADDEILSVSGEEVLGFLKRLHADAGMWGELMTAVSRFLDTEANLVDRYAGWAEHEAGFLVVYSPTEAEASGTAELLQPFEPLAAHWYTAGCIRHLV